jgi:SHS2 domain-containing protein
MSSTNDYEIIDHTADIGIKVMGNTLSNVIEKSILALSNLMIGKVKIIGKEKRKFNIEEENIEIALVRILEEILYLFENQRFAVSRCKVDKKKNNYEIELKGKVYDLEEVKEATEIKAVTYHKLSVKQLNDNWMATVIFDI